MKIIKKSNLNFYPQRNFLLASVLTIFFCNSSNVISQPLIDSNNNVFTQNSKKSFITESVEKTGPSVTIETQRYVKQRKFSRHPRILLDPYFERFWIRFTL